MVPMVPVGYRFINLSILVSVSSSHQISPIKKALLTQVNRLPCGDLSDNYSAAQEVENSKIFTPGPAIRPTSTEAFWENSAHCDEFRSPLFQHTVPPTNTITITTPMAAVCRLLFVVAKVASNKNHYFYPHPYHNCL